MEKGAVFQWLVWLGAIFTSNGRSIVVFTDRWRGRMQVALHSAWIHIIIVLLVVADALIVIFELLLDVGAFSKK